MTPLPYVWPYALLFWGVFLWAFVPEFAIVRRAKESQTATDSKSLQVIVRGMSLAFFASFPLAWIRPLRFAPEHQRAALLAGIALMVAGSLLRRHCWRMLGASFTGDVRASAGQHVVDRGAYRLLRHPSYTAGVVLNAGVGVALGSWAAALLLTVASVAVYLVRIAVEERALVGAIGEPYREFMRTRKRLIPFVY